MYTHTHTHTHIYIYGYIHIHIYISLYIYTHIYIYIHINICICIYVYITQLLRRIMIVQSRFTSRFRSKATFANFYPQKKKGANDVATVGMAAVADACV